jgi:hypothetical protein
LAAISDAISPRASPSVRPGARRPTLTLNVASGPGVTFSGFRFRGGATQVTVAGGNQWSAFHNIFEEFTGRGVWIQSTLGDSCECAISDNSWAVSASAIAAFDWNGGGDVRLMNNKINTNGPAGCEPLYPPGKAAA